MMFYLVLLISLLYSVCACGQDKVILKSYDDGTPSIEVWFKEKAGSREKVREISYYASGKKDYEGNYRNGMEHGKWTYYYKNGQVMDEEFYKNGLEDGKHTEYSPDGQIVKIEFYKQGKVTKVIEH